jgi:CheY-like chemotaxis protein
MIRTIAGLTLLTLAVSTTLGQDDLLVPYGKTPETAPEFWAVVKYEVSLGNYRRAREQLKNFWDKLAAEADQDKFLLSLHDKDGLAYFVKLSNIPELRELKDKDPDTEKERPIIDILTQRVGRAASARYKDPDRIRFFIKRLSGPQEERSYAIDQLRKSGPLAVPPMIEVLRDPQLDARSKEAVYTALLKMNREAAPPLLACLDSNDAKLRGLIVDWFLLRADDRIVPYLWYLHGRKDLVPSAKEQVTNALARFTRTNAKDLGDPRVKCLKEAERWYNHQVEPPPGEMPTIWTWDETAGPVGRRVTPSQAEEYWATYWAKKALELDPEYHPAQILFLSTLMEKAHERNGVEQPLSKTAPEVHNLTAGARSQLMEQVLDKAMAENRTAVALAAVRALGHAGEWRLVRASDRGTPPLLRALSYPDRRVQMAAAEAILQVPSNDGFPGSSRVVEVLRRAIASDAMPRALIGMSDSTAGQQLAATLRGFGYEPALATTGRQAIKLASELGDVEIIFLEPGIHEVGGLNAVLAQFRGNADTAGIPIVVLAQPDQEQAAKSLAARYQRVHVFSPPPASVELFKEKLDPIVGELHRTPLTEAERRAYATQALDWLNRMASGEKPGFDIRPADAAVIRALTSDELAPKAAAFVAQRSGKTAQMALADILLNESRPAPVRAEVARQLRVSLQRHGTLLKPDQLAALLKLPSSVEDASLKEQATRIATALHPDAASDGNRLKSFPPALPRAPGENGDKN